MERGDRSQRTADARDRSHADSVRGLVLVVKAYERLAIRAAVEQVLDLAKLALLANPIVGEWQPAVEVLEAPVHGAPERLDT